MFPVVYSTVPTIWNSNDEDDLEEVAKEILLLEKDICSINGECGNIDLNIRGVLQLLQQLYVNEHLELSNLQKEFLSLQSETTKELPPNTTTVEKEQVEVEDKAEDEPTHNRKTRREIDMLWRKIASKCHPDKTKDKTLHEVFLQARKALQENDIVMLREIAAGLAKGRRKFSKLRRILNELQHKRESLLKDLSMIRNSIEYRMYDMWKLPHLQGEVKAFHKQQIMLSINNIRARIQELKMKTNNRNMNRD